MFLEFLQATLFGRHPGTFPEKPELFRERVGIAHLVDVQTGDGHGAAVVFFEKQGGEPEGEMEHEGLGIVVQVPQIEQQLGQGRGRKARPLIHPGGHSDRSRNGGRVDRQA